MVEVSSMDQHPNVISIDGVEYTRAAAAPKGTRCVVVVDRGWIFAGDVTRANGRIRLDRALHVLRWDTIGFAGMVAAPKGGKVTTKPCAPVDMPEGAELFCVPVADDWGL